jgi:hypothetical protein
MGKLHPAMNKPRNNTQSNDTRVRKNGLAMDSLSNSPAILLELPILSTSQILHKPFLKLRRKDVSLCSLRSKHTKTAEVPRQAYGESFRFQ